MRSLVCVESSDFKTAMLDTAENTADSGKIFFKLCGYAGQIYMGFEADTPKK